MFSRELNNLKVIEMENPAEEYIWESMTWESLEVRASSLTYTLPEMMFLNEKGYVKLSS